MPSEPERRIDGTMLWSIVQTTTDAVVSIDEQGVLTSWNRAATEIFGWEAGEVLGRLLTEVLVPPELRDAHTHGLRRFVETRVSRVSRRPMALTAMRRDGSTLPVEVTIWPSRGVDGLRFHAFLREEDDDTRQRARLERSEDRYQRLASSAPGASFTHWVGADHVGHTEFVAGGTDLLLGLSAAQTPDLELLVHADDREDFGLTLDVSRGDLSPFTWQGRLTLPDGSAPTVMVSAFPIALPDGATQWDGLVLDVTAETAAQHVILDQGRRADLLSAALDALLARSSDAEAVVDLDGRVLAASAAARRALGGRSSLDVTRHPTETLRDLAGEPLGHVVRLTDPSGC